MIEKLLALAPKTANCKLHFFVPFNFRAYSFLPVLQILIKFSNTSTWNNNSFDIHETIIKPNSVIRIYVRTEFIFSRL